ncbi:MAG TPA: DUF1552 domain-containing protein [Gammaproteobacteria bacterium]|nr:DUF1552 domain-containing protein [Gammaproteobacteria bacterium]
MFITKKHLDRRTFLRGALGTAIALPFLDAMVPAATAQSLTAARPRFRFGTVYMPNGVYPGMWHPEKAGKDFEFNHIMKPLERHRDVLTTISQLKAPEGQKNMGGIHMGASAAFLNGTGPVGKNGDFNLIRSKKSIDQYIADAIAGDTPMRSLELGTEDMGTSAGACDGYPCIFFNTMAWYDDQSPLPVSVNPQVTFERMFGDPGTPAQRLARLQAKESMLDSVLDETKRLQKMIGPSDNALLDEYLTNIHRVEEQVKKMMARSSVLESTSDAPVGIPEDFDAHMTVTYDLLHLAFQGDMTRVFSFMVGHEASGRSYQFVGVKEPHHSTSHHKGTPESLDQYARINVYHMTKLAEFLDKLKATPDGEGTLADSAIIYFGAGMSNGVVHDRHNVPALLLGRAHGRLEGNRHIVAEKDVPTSNLLLALADKFGAEVDSIGVSTGRFEI